MLMGWLIVAPEAIYGNRVFRLWCHWLPPQLPQPRNRLLSGQADFPVIVMQRSQDSLFSFLHRLVCSYWWSLGALVSRLAP